MTTPGFPSSIPCQGHIRACTHQKGLFACAACVRERSQRGRLYCPDLDHCAGPGCMDENEQVEPVNACPRLLPPSEWHYGQPTYCEPAQNEHDADDVPSPMSNYRDLAASSAESAGESTVSGS